MISSAPLVKLIDWIYICRPPTIVRDDTPKFLDIFENSVYIC